MGFLVLRWNYSIASIQLTSQVEKVTLFLEHHYDSNLKIDWKVGESHMQLRPQKIRFQKSFCSILLLASLFLGTACENMFDLKNQEKTGNTVRRNEQKVNESAGIGVQPREIDPLSVTDDIWLGNQALRIHKGKPLPSKYEGESGFTMVSAAPLDLKTIADQIANSTNLGTTVGDMVLATTTGASPTEGNIIDNTGGETGFQGLPSVVTSNNKSISVSYTGPLSKFLDQISNQLDVSWRFDGQKINFFRYESRSFVIESMSSKGTSSDSFKPSSSSSSSGGSSSVDQESTMTSDVDYWKDLEAALKSMLGSDGAEVMVPSSGTVLVTARPAKLEAVAKYIEDENRRLTRQLAIDVVAYDVTVSSSDNYGLNLANAFSYRNNSNPGKRGSATFSLSTPTASFLSEPGGTLSIAYLSSHWSGQSIAKALSTLGNTIEITRAPIVTLNNKTASRKIAVDQTYIQSISTQQSTTAGVAPTTTITPATASSGISLQVLPRITHDDRILLQYSISISTVNKITQTCADTTTTTGTGGTSSSSSGNNCVGTPNTSNKVFVQQALLQNGSTLVLAGFEQAVGEDSSEGIGSALNWLMGGVDSSNKRQQLVITITPREITPDRGGM